jgi:hypothetical protein
MRQVKSEHFSASELLTFREESLSTPSGDAVSISLRDLETLVSPVLLLLPGLALSSKARR